MWRLSWPTRPEMDEMLTMAPPPPCRMAGTACFMPRNTPLALMLMRVSHADVLRVSGSCDPLIPALFTRMSSRPKAPVAVRTASCQSSSLDTSSFTNCALPPSALIFDVTCRPSASMTSATTTIAPSRAKRTASLSPMPWAPPVIIATFPPSLMGLLRARVRSRPPYHIVGLVDEAHHAQAVVHAHGRRHAAPPVVDDVTDRRRIQCLGRLRGQRLLAPHGDEPHRIVVVVHEHRVAPGALRPEEHGGEVFHALPEGARAELRPRHRGLLAGEEEKEIQDVRAQVAEAAA